MKSVRDNMKLWADRVTSLLPTGYLCCICILFCKMNRLLHWRTGQAVKAVKVFLAVTWPPPSTCSADNGCFSPIPLSNCYQSLADPWVKYPENPSNCGWQCPVIPYVVHSQVLVSFPLHFCFFLMHRDL